VKKGDELTLRVISVNAGRRRIGLSLRQAPPPEETAEVEEELEPELVPDDQAIPVEVQEAAEETVVPEGEAEELAEVEEDLEPEVAPDDQVIPEEVQEMAEEIFVPEGEADELAEVREELEPELAPDDRVIPGEVQEAAEEIFVPEEEAQFKAEGEEMGSDTELQVEAGEERPQKS
jgi:hypothetical protein